VLDFLVGLNSICDEDFSSVIASFPSSPPIERAANQVPFSTPESVVESYSLFQRDPFGAISPKSTSPSISPPTLDLNPTHSLVSASVSSPACLSPDRQLSAVREQRLIAPSASQPHKCPHCQHVIRRHVKHNHLRCDVEGCGKILASGQRKDLDRHKRHAHRDLFPTSALTCGQCKYKTIRSDNLRRHVKNCHSRNGERQKDNIGD
jgi:hypothetical protein